MYSTFLEEEVVLGVYSAFLDEEVVLGVYSAFLDEEVVLGVDFACSTFLLEEVGFCTC